MTNHMVTVFTCHVCGEAKFEQPERECCGVKYCFPCIHRTSFSCHVCMKDELNEPIQCDICGTYGNAFTVQRCGSVSAEGCQMWVCHACNKAGPTLDGTASPFKYCSYKHFQEMLRDLMESVGSWDCCLKEVPFQRVKTHQNRPNSTQIPACLLSSKRALLTITSYIT